MTSINGKRRRIGDDVVYFFIYLSAALSVVLLAGIIIYVFVRGIGQVNWQFLTSETSVLRGTVGIAGNLLNTLYIIIITMLIATPVGVGAAVYLNEYAKPGKLVSTIEFATETLAGIPSIIFGLFGMMFFGQTIGFGYSILTGSLTLTLMVLLSSQEIHRKRLKLYRTATDTEQSDLEPENGTPSAPSCCHQPCRESSQVLSLQSAE